MSKSAPKYKHWVEKFFAYMENTEPPNLFKEWVGMSVVSSALQRKCFFQKGKYTFFPNLYVVLVGPPATRKGTAMAPGKKLLAEADIIPAANMTTLQALIAYLDEQTTTTMSEEGRLVLHSSMTIFSDEWSVFTGYNNQELFSTLNNWFDCVHPWEYRTKTQGINNIPAVYVTMLGATTPKLLSIALPSEAIGGGFTSRTIFVVEKEQGRVIPPMDESDEEVALYDELAEGIRRIALMAGPFRSTAEFDEAWADWYLDSRQNEEPPHPGLETYYGRRFRHLTAMAMNLSAAESADLVLDVRHLEWASDLLHRTEIRMKSMFDGWSIMDKNEIMRVVSDTLATRKVVSEREMLKLVYGSLEDGMNTFNTIMETLCHAGFCRRFTRDRQLYYQYMLEDKDNGS